MFWVSRFLSLFLSVQDNENNQNQFSLSWRTVTTYCFTFSARRSNAIVGFISKLKKQKLKWTNEAPRTRNKCHSNSMCKRRIKKDLHLVDDNGAYKVINVNLIFDSHRIAETINNSKSKQFAGRTKKGCTIFGPNTISRLPFAFFGFRPWSWRKHTHVSRTLHFNWDLCSSQSSIRSFSRQTHWCDFDAAINSRRDFKIRKFSRFSRQWKRVASCPIRPRQFIDAMWKWRTATKTTSEARR